MTTVKPNLPPTPAQELDDTIVVLRHRPGQGLDLHARLPPRVLVAIKVLIGVIVAYFAGGAW